MVKLKTFDEMKAGDTVYSVSCKGVYREYLVQRTFEPLNKTFIPIELLPYPSRDVPSSIVLLGRRASTYKGFIRKNSNDWEWIFTSQDEALNHLINYLNRKKAIKRNFMKCP